MKVRSILCPVDFSDATAAGIAPAVSLATEFGAELTVLHVLNFPFAQIDALPPDFDVAGYYADMSAQAEQEMAELVDNDALDYLDLKLKVGSGVPYAEIVRACEDDGHDLLVMPTHARSGLGRMLLGSTAEKVVRLAPCPVLTTHPREHPPAFNPDVVLFATDFSDSADRALLYATEIARQYAARLVLLHVVTLWEYDPANPSWRFPAIPGDLEGKVVASAEGRLDECGARANGGNLEVETKLIRGFDAAAEIVRVATEEVHADLIVMGTHGHTGLAHMLLGSVAGKVVRNFDGPVLTIRQSDH